MSVKESFYFVGMFPEICRELIWLSTYSYKENTLHLQMLAKRG